MREILLGKSMLYHLSLALKSYWSIFNVVHYVSFRAIAALLSTLLFSLVYGNRFIDKSKLFFRSKAREWAPESHKVKDNMPTMGGIFIIGAVFINCLLWCNLFAPQIWILLLCLLGFGAIGFWDDWCKIHHTRGISARTKSLLQVSVGLLVSVLWLFTSGASTTVVFPFFKGLQPDIGLFFIPWMVLVLVGCSNAVNLTDGLDGLAIGSLIPNFVTFSIIGYIAGHYKLASYLQIPFVGSAEIAVVGATLVGASLGFLWFNTYPAQIFMGDVGSLALGAVLALMALMAKQELLLLIAGGLFVLEAVSVILQVASYRWLGRRIFKMAPIHHHFELMGWQESKITVRFAIISFVLCLLALITLKLR
ncbi:phospho-N-acetylmuramoyl-pentapeptide-transferase [Methylicorpusculum sp.]|uniref:phospho-N-acetylmuramoyl-pentapeptide- transferase n=1 Tax=Methylicorpusculum sp. TaxID=2713644 RepID=UPI002AB87D57|nr:phospho-N-acetylmuramoyl-pentapeptide-transferase [Methylicorpusculum sp.]MDZ4152945.1 phospho-N-acetylmuramoyl-pentapeptide-transferase [Methylicorpusculum sp.]